MRKIIYTRPDGGISVVGPVRNTVGETLTTDEDIEQRAWNKLPADAINPQWVEDSSIPTDRTFRDAWSQSGTDIVVDMVRARDIQEKRIKTAQRIKVRDILEREALGENVASEKAAVRAVNPRVLVDSVSTTDELRAAFPAILR